MMRAKPHLFTPPKLRLDRETLRCSGRDPSKCPEELAPALPKLTREASEAIAILSKTYPQHGTPEKPKFLLDSSPQFHICTLKSLTENSISFKIEAYPQGKLDQK